MASLIDALRQYADDFTGSLNPELKGYFDWRNANAEQTKKTFRDMASGEVTPEAIEQSMDLVTPMAGVTKILRGAGRAERAAEQGYDLGDQWYHFSHSPNIAAFDPSLSTNQSKASFFTKDKEFLDEYGGDDLKLGSTVYPAVVRKDANLWDYETADYDDLVDYLKQSRYLNTHKGNFSFLGGDNTRYQMYPKELVERLQDGDWEIIESKAVQDYLKDRGFEGFYNNESGSKNMGIFDPSKIRSPNAEFDPNKMDSSDILASVLRGEQNYA
jgi:hypothetical protein